MRFLHVPVLVDVSPIPELPSIIRLPNGEAAALVRTNPVTYRWGGKAPVVKEHINA